MNEINLFYKLNNSRNGFQAEVLNELYKKLPINNCVCEASTSDGKDMWCNDHIVYIDSQYTYTCTYDRMCDENSLPAVGQELLEKLLPYESMAIKLGMRRTNFPIELYEQEKRLYYKHVRFWNYILDKYRINCVYFDIIPHAQHDYVIYALAKVKKIKMVVMTPTVIANYFAVGEDIPSLGNNIQKYYEELGEKHISEEDLYPAMLQFYKKCKDSGGLTKKDRKNIKNKIYEIYFAQYWNEKRYFSYCWHFVRGVVYYKILHRDSNGFDVLCNSFALRRYEQKRLRIWKKLCGCRRYDVKAQMPDYSKSYIYFALQLTPEETTIPRAGVFAEQYNAIQLLARSVHEYGISVYVKEHFVQLCRDKDFYCDIEKIPNVCLIRSDVAARDLIEKSIAVATQTGSVIFEGVVRGKPALVFGDGYVWKGMPGVFQIRDEESGRQIGEKLIKKEINIPQREILRYLYAIQEKCVVYRDGMVNSDQVLERSRQIVQIMNEQILEVFQADSQK